MLISNCCYSRETEVYPSEHQICPRCKDHCTFVDEESGDQPDAGDREFSPAQLAQIEALQKSWDEQEAQEQADEAEWLREHEQGTTNEDNHSS